MPSKKGITCWCFQTEVLSYFEFFNKMYRYASACLQMGDNEGLIVVSFSLKNQLLTKYFPEQNLQAFQGSVLP